MSKLYVFAIGGSGSRVLRSLTMLMASGVGTSNEVVPIIIDPDTPNGDRVRTEELLRLYESIRAELNFNESIKNKFFSTELASINKNGVFTIPIHGTSGIAYENWLNLSTMSLENQALTRMLFSNANLSSKMDVGFKGNPNIGSVVLNQLTKQRGDFNTFETNFVKGDKVFIISSIFGGTGASGFPLLLKTFRTSTNKALAQAPIGAVSLLPYFNLKDNPKSSIKADSFITKAKAALNYYEKNVTGNKTLDDMYYLGDDISSKSYDNYDGGDEQQNDAHIIELLAALSILDFDSKQINIEVKSRATNFHEFGLMADQPKEIIFSDFGDKTKRKLRTPLSQMAILNSYLNNRSLDHRLSQRWAKDRSSILGDTLFNSEFYSNFSTFKDLFNGWLSELGNNKIGFKPFKDDTEVKGDALEIVHGIKPKYGILSKKGYDLMDVRLGKNLGKVQENLSAPKTFMELFYITTLELCTNNLKMN